ncbi:Nramp family divalent metal transporter [Alienimonas californiensis]|uniref:Nramp family divalent metal transporter n=1 Tax=Alienimonas californiensis TaxID=2527989 RepID=UPI0011A63A9B|nr:Nramp family divalent metal transporter [Alienimonas californiensis]
MRTESSDSAVRTADPTEPPTTLLGTLKHLGPGVIIAGAIVGSGELFATTGTGARVGIGLLWLILLGCAIKVFVQVELGRAAVATGRTTLDLLNRVPGPRVPTGARFSDGTARAVNWVVLLWAAMMLTQLGQVGGLAGGVGQAMHLALPGLGEHGPALWATLAGILTAALLWGGRYRLIQALSAVLVAAFTALTVGNAVALQSTPEFALPTGDLLAGLNPLNDLVDAPDAVFIALAAFGLIGVGATELVAYPYWCLEKGYARFAGVRPNEASAETPAWTARAKGWMRVMRADAFAALVVYTVSTVAFYLIGAAVLHPTGVHPQGSETISALASAYEPVFGKEAGWLFLAGAVAVLYSTLLIATAANARMWADGARVAGWLRDDEGTYRFAVKILSVLLTAISVGLFVFVSSDPVLLVVIGGVAQSLLLPVLGVAALWMRFRVAPPGLRPGAVWTACLFLSVAGLALAGAFGGYTAAMKLIEWLNAAV